MLWTLNHVSNKCINLLHLVPTDWADYRTEYTITANSYSAVRYFKPCKCLGVLAKAIQLTAVQDVDVTLYVLSDFKSMLQ